MLKTPLFGLIFSLIAVIAVLHLVALNFNFYWEIWWFDRVMHFLGGFWIALVTLWFVFFSPFFNSEKVKNKRFGFFLVLALVSSLGVGVAWEVFELIGGITSLSYAGYWDDTIGDIIMDAVGGVVAASYVYQAYRKHSLGVKPTQLTFNE